MTTLKETIGKLNKLYSELYDSNDGFACSTIINDIELALKSYGRECSKASLEKASDSIDEYCDIYNDQLERYPAEEEVRKAIKLESNIVLL